MASVLRYPSPNMLSTVSAFLLCAISLIFSLPRLVIILGSWTTDTPKYACLHVFNLQQINLKYMSRDQEGQLRGHT